MNGNYNQFEFSDPMLPCATFNRVFVARKQTLLRTSTKKRQRIRKAGIIGIILIITSMLLILSRL